MGRKISENERFLAFALKCSKEELDNAIDTLQAVKRSRTPVKERAARKPKPVKQPDKAASASGD